MQYLRRPQPPHSPEIQLTTSPHSLPEATSTSIRGCNKEHKANRAAHSTTRNRHSTCHHSLRRSMSSTSTPPKWSENAPLEPRVIKCLAMHPSSLHPSHFSSLPFMSPLSPSHLQARRPCSGSRGHSPLELSTLHKGARARKQSAGPH